ncbi:MAG: hypothetical protein QOF76_30 [Solirubrobacteraceae bacterium]|jgi:hypothetical protein|nr:hypothetical protein [Solirubrobacteraceae bacterium]
MNDFSTAPAIVALAAAGLALIAVAWAGALSMRLRRLRAAQRIVLGEDGARDVTEHAAELQRAFETLRAGVQDTATQIDERLGVAEHRLDGTLAYRALVRYDAYGELSGHQSTTLALLDAEHNGVVLTSIAHRDAARMYCKQVVAGKGDVELSPEEVEAVRLALAGEITARTLD